MRIAANADLRQVHDGHVAAPFVDGVAPQSCHCQPRAPSVLARIRDLFLRDVVTVVDDDGNEVTFDTENVTSLDWVTYPTLRHTDAPERIDIVLVNGDPNPNRPDLPMYGAGETICKPLMATVANAIYDATGVRLRRLPFKAERVLAALKAGGA